MTRKPLSNTIHKLRGTYRADRHEKGSIPVADGPAVAPDWLSKPGRKYFAKFRKRVEPLGFDSETFSDEIALVASCQAEIAECNAFIDKEGSTYKSVTASGFIRRKYPEVEIRGAAKRHLHALLADFGLTPAAASRVSGSAPEPPGAFDHF